jgi:hypothetical protein
MRPAIWLSLAGASTLALSSLANSSAHATDMPAPQAQVQPPPGYYGPPAEESEAYPPPPAPYAYAAPPAVAYYAYAPPVVVAPYPYYWRGYYGPRVAYGYGRWGRGYRRW